MVRRAEIQNCWKQLPALAIEREEIIQPGPEKVVIALT
jgi:hypothetical protein